MLFLVCVLWTAGCATIYETSALRKDEALLSARLRAQKTLRGRGTIRLSTRKGEETRGKAAIFVKGPDKVRIEVFGPFGQVMAVLVSDADALSIFSNHETTFFPRSIDTPFSLTPQELAGIIMGTDFQSGGAEAGAAKYLIERDRAGNIKKIISFAKGPGERKVVMKDFREIEGVYFPFSISVEDANERLHIRYSSVELNLDLKDALFIHIVDEHPEVDK